MTPLEIKLTAALRANSALRVKAERLIAAHVVPESDRQAIMNDLITLFDGPEQREAERMTREALSDDEKWQISVRYPIMRLALPSLQSSDVTSPTEERLSCSPPQSLESRKGTRV